MCELGRAVRRAVFLDRDGVLNRNVFYRDTQAWESPRRVGEFVPADGVPGALKALQDRGFLLFLVSNQPNVVNGKSSRVDLETQHGLLVAWLRAGGVKLRGAFYCTHHPAFTGTCVCRKPSPYFLLEAARVHTLSLAECWMVGDRATDMQCGRAAGVRTAWVRTGQETAPTPGLWDVVGSTLGETVDRLLHVPMHAR